MTGSTRDDLHHRDVRIFSMDWKVAVYYNIFGIIKKKPTKWLLRHRPCVATEYAVRFVMTSDCISEGYHWRATRLNYKYDPKEAYGGSHIERVNLVSAESLSLVIQFFRTEKHTSLIANINKKRQPLWSVCSFLGPSTFAVSLEKGRHRCQYQKTNCTRLAAHVSLSLCVGFLADKRPPTSNWPLLTLYCAIEHVINSTNSN